MKIALPYRHSFNGQELKYCLRGIEKYIINPQITLIGDLPKWIKNVDFIPFRERRDDRWKERNIYEKLRLMKEDFIYFNDDHYLLEPFNYEYHYSGYLADKFDEYFSLKSPFYQTIANTVEALNFGLGIRINGQTKNYYRHQPFLINVDQFKKIHLDWDKEWGYCIKSIYCHLAGIEGIEYPDLKFKVPTPEKKILELIKGRQYFSTEEGGMNKDMMKVLDNLYPNKSRYEQ